MLRGLHGALAASLLALLAASTGDLGAQTPASGPHPCESYETRAERDHPLACRVFGADGREISLDALADVIGEARFTLLGEIHDNPDHHRLRAGLIARLGSRVPAEPGQPRQPALVFEHLKVTQSRALEPLVPLQAIDPSPEQVQAAIDALERDLDWTTSGWPRFAMFAPLFSAAIRGRHAIAAGDPPRDKVRAVARSGLAALAADEAHLGLAKPLPPPLQDALLGDLEASHCGLMPRTAFGTMADAQRYRDAHLADVLVARAGTNGRAVLLAGNGHVRTDRGAAYYVRASAPGASIVSVLIAEVDPTKTDPKAYVPTGPEGQPAADFVILTPRVERADPCVEMRKRFTAPPK